MELFNPTAFASQIFWLVIFFATQYLLLSKLILPKLKKIFDDRARHVKEEILLAEKLTNEASILKEDFETKIEQAHSVCIAKMSTTLEQIKQNSSKQLAKLEKSLAKDTLKQELQLDKFTSSVQNELVDITLSTASMIISTIANHDIEPKNLKKYLV